MLYLIKEFGKENKEYLKIGKADNINKRMQQYNTDCAEFELIDTFEGSLPEETLLHSFLKRYKIKGEWMEYNEEILLLWKLYKEIRPKIKESLLQHEQYISKDKYNFEIEKYKSKYIECNDLLSKYQELTPKLCEKYDQIISQLKERITELEKKLKSVN